MVTISPSTQTRPSGPRTSLEERCARLLDENARVAALYPLSDYARTLTDQPLHRGYAFINDRALAVSKNIASTHGTSMASRYRKLVLAHFIGTVEGRLPQEKLPDSIARLLRRELDRIVDEFDQLDDAFYDFSNDLFLKDLGLCMLRLLPCGAELVQVGAGVPRSLLFRGGLLQFGRALFFFGLKLRGFRPLYALHMDPRRKEEFTPEGWERSYVRIAELLERHPEVKGVFGTAWFYDPVIERISPHLGYLRTTREKNGASNFRYGSYPDVVGSALATSRTRRSLHEKGHYVPTSYYLVWPRKELLHWARANRHRVSNNLYS